MDEACMCLFKKGFIWLGWVVDFNKQYETPSPLYYDNTPSMTIKSVSPLVYATFGFNKQRVFKRLKKYICKKL